MLNSNYFLLTLLSSAVPTATAYKLCPLLGPVYPQPTGLAHDPSFQDALADLTQKTQQIATSGSSEWTTVATNSTVSFSAGAFSLDSTELLFHFDSNAPNATIKSWAPGAKTTTDSDTRYALGSVSKLLTVYAFLAAIGDGCWNEPITKFVPELAEAASNPSMADMISYANWDDITVGDIASQLSGIGRDTTTQSQSMTPVPGLPPPVAQVCNGAANCSRADFFTDLIQHPPVFASSTTPIYSNNAYTILAYAAENITGKSFHDVFDDNLVTPLGLGKTTYVRPENSETLMPASFLAAPFFPTVGEDTPAQPYGGMFSSVNDLAMIGRSILNSTLLRPAMTRRWMKPHSHSADLTSSVGAPWEIQRTQINGRVVDLYTKAGDILASNSFFVLVPDYNVGFVTLAVTTTMDPKVVSSEGHNTAAVITNQIGQTLLPALEDVARNQALANFAGTYRNETSNTTVTISTNTTFPGITLSQITTGAGINLATSSAFADADTIGLPLQTTNLRWGNSVAFRKVSQEASLPVNVTGIVTPQCYNWQLVDSGNWNNQPRDEFVFTLDASGKAITVEPVILQETLTRVE